MAPDAELLGSKRHTAPPRLHTARIHEAKQFGFGKPNCLAPGAKQFGFNSVHPAPDCKPKYEIIFLGERALAKYGM